MQVVTVELVDDENTVIQSNDVILYDGRIHVKSLLRHYQTDRLLLLYGEHSPILQYGTDGFSIWNGFEADKVYRVIQDEDYDPDYNPDEDDQEVPSEEYSDSDCESVD